MFASRPTAAVCVPSDTSSVSALNQYPCGNPQLNAKHRSFGCEDDAKPLATAPRRIKAFTRPIDDEPSVAQRPRGLCRRECAILWFEEAKQYLRRRR